MQARRLALLQREEVKAEVLAYQEGTPAAPPKVRRLAS
jgi:hypothetical protein